MSIEERQGTIDQVNEKGIVLGGARLSYSKWFEGNRPTEDALGHQVTVVVDAGEKCTFLKKIVRIGEKASGWKPPEPGQKGFPGGGGGRRFSPEELELKREEGIRIARSVAIDRAITMAREVVSIDTVVPLARVIEEYVLKGLLPQVTISSQQEAPGRGIASPVVHPESSRVPVPLKEAAPPQPAKPKRLAAKVVSALFNEALRGGLVKDWTGFLSCVEDVLRVRIKNPYQLDLHSFAKVEAVIRSNLGRSTAA